MAGEIVKLASPLIDTISVPETVTLTVAPAMPMSSVPLGWRVIATVPPMSSTPATPKWTF